MYKRRFTLIPLITKHPRMLCVLVTVVYRFYMALAVGGNVCTDIYVCAGMTKYTSTNRSSLQTFYSFLIDKTFKTTWQKGIWRCKRRPITLFHCQLFDNNGYRDKGLQSSSLTKVFFYSTLLFKRSWFDHQFSEVEPSALVKRCRMQITLVTLVWVLLLSSSVKKNKQHSCNFNRFNV